MQFELLFELVTEKLRRFRLKRLILVMPVQ